MYCWVLLVRKLEADGYYSTLLPIHLLLLTFPLSRLSAVLLVQLAQIKTSARVDPTVLRCLRHLCDAGRAITALRPVCQSTPAVARATPGPGVRLDQRRLPRTHAQLLERTALLPLLAYNHALQ